MNNNPFGRTSEVFIRTGSKDGVTELNDVYFTAPFKVMHPFLCEDGWKEIMIMSVSAGTMAGDKQCYHMEIGSGSKVLITSQSYEKIHRMKEGFAQREINIVVEPDAILYYRPQPVIPYAGSDFRSRTKVILKGENSQLIMSDILCSGRAAMGERFAYQYYSNFVEIYKIDIFKNENPILSYRDNTRYEPQNPVMDMNGFGMYEGYGYLLNLLFCNIVVDKVQLEKVRSYLEEAEKEEITGGVTRTWDGDLVVRALGMSAEKLEMLSTAIVRMSCSPHCLH